MLCKTHWSTNRTALVVVAFTALVPHALANPAVGAVSEAPMSAPSCRVFLAGKQKVHRTLILHWSDQVAHMQIDGSPVILAAREASCRSECQSPGKSGYRLFHFSSNRAEARLRKRVSCQRDAEVCTGLPDGPAQLVVRSGGGTTTLRVRTEYCDL